jgi:hypothetical protein
MCARGQAPSRAPCRAYFAILFACIHVLLVCLPVGGPCTWAHRALMPAQVGWPADARACASTPGTHASSQVCQSACTSHGGMLAYPLLVVFPFSDPLLLLRHSAAEWGATMEEDPHGGPQVGSLARQDTHPRPQPFGMVRPIMGAAPRGGGHFVPTWCLTSWVARSVRYLPFCNLCSSCRGAGLPPRHAGCPAHHSVCGDRRPLWGGKHGAVASVAETMCCGLLPHRCAAASP